MTAANGTRQGLRVAVYTDYAYHSVDGRVFAERAFALFLARLATLSERFVVVGRLDPTPARARYPLGDAVEFFPLPFYPSLARVLSAAWGMLRSLPRLWRALDGVEVVWVLGPHPLGVVLAGLAVARRRRVVLGVRQDLPAYVRHRHPTRRFMGMVTGVLERTWRGLARFLGVVTVGPELARNYAHARHLHELTVSLVSEAELAAEPPARDYGGDLTVLSVGRIDREKDPLLLADVLGRLREDGQRWRLVVCGEGDMEDELRARLRELGVEDHAVVRGYVPHAELLDEYRQAHALLHVSLTEGLPQVLDEAFAADLPVVATDVGGVRNATGAAVRLVPSGDAAAAAAELRRVADDPELRGELVAAGREHVGRHTIEGECARLAAFLAA